jgi:hypothetical protein
VRTLAHARVSALLTSHELRTVAAPATCDDPITTTVFLSG